MSMYTTLAGHFLAYGLEMNRKRIQKLGLYNKYKNNNLKTRDQEWFFFTAVDKKYKTGRGPGGTRTNWLMHEYRLVDDNQGLELDAYVLCEVFSKQFGKIFWKHICSLL
ncbi:hypothetical protein Bca4012_082899 [Brassica carinata]